MSEGREQSPRRGMTFEQMEAANRAGWRADYTELSGAERVKQVIELSRQMTRLASRHRPSAR